jgi:hypothetical protein
MPTMAKKIQSNECSLTAAVWAKLEAKAAEARSVHPAKPIVQSCIVRSNQSNVRRLEVTHGCHLPVTLPRMSMAPPDLLNDRNHPGEFHVKQCSPQPSFGDRGIPPHSHGLRDVRVSLGRR